MKYLKTYEKWGFPFFKKGEDNAKVGDYVICEFKTPSYEFNDFIDNNIGVIVEKWKSITRGAIWYNVKYDNIPDNIITLFGTDVKAFMNEHSFRARDFKKNSKISHSGILNIICGRATKIEIGKIIYFSKNKEDVEIALTAKKYNL